MSAASTRGFVSRAARATARRAGRGLRTATLPRAAAGARWDLERAFLARCARLNAPSVLELGTLQSVPGRSTVHRDWVPHAAEFLGSDIAPGPDVDVVADAHRLSAAVGPERFDVIISCSTFEHLKYPALAAHELLKALKVGGVLFVQTHQSFPLHGYPSDYFRFSQEALAGLFGTTMGFEVKATNYDFPAKIVSRREPGTQDMPAYLNTTLWGEKHSPTPDEYRYELPPVPGA
jgi:SAM-dependent methyltransferase